MNAYLTLAHANGDVRCSLCPAEILAGQPFWRMSRGENGNSVVICMGHIPQNTTGFIVRDDSSNIRSVAPVYVDVREEILPRLIENWDAVYELSAELFEELVFECLVSMGLQGFRNSPSNMRDGGIDIVVWSRGPLATTMAVQVKQVRTPDAKIGPSAVREFSASLSDHNFESGMLITNGEFTDAARWLVKEKSTRVRLRDGASLRNWIVDDFTEDAWNARTRTVELCPGVTVNVPQPK